MDKETKIFFEKLAGINNEDEEFKPQLTKSPVQDSEPLVKEEEEPLNEIFEETEGELAIDVYQTPTNFIVESTIAGVNPENIDISITPESIIIRGKREKEEKVKAENYLYQECYWGGFSRSIILPQEIDPDKAQANIKNGILKISLPKINKTKGKKIKVKFE